MTAQDREKLANDHWRRKREARERLDYLCECGAGDIEDANDLGS